MVALPAASAVEIVGLDFASTPRRSIVGPQTIPANASANLTDAPSSITVRLIRGAGWMMAWRVFSRSLGFVSVLILAGLLTPADFGIVALATALTGAIDSMSQLGVRDALVRLADDRRDYYDTAFTFQVARGLLTALLIAGTGVFATRLIGDPRVCGVLYVLAVLSFISGFENIGVVKFSRALDFKKQFVIQSAPRLLGFLVTTLLAVLLRSYWALVIGSLLAKVLGVAVTYALSPYRPRFGLVGWRYLLHFSFWSWAGSLAIMVLARADPFLLGPVLGVAGLGLFMLASDIAFLPVSELLEPACAVLFPGFALASRRGTEPVGMGLSIAGALALLTVPFSIGVSACSGYLVTGLLGPQWAAAQPVIAILAWMCVFSPFSYVSASVLSAQGRVARVFATHAIAALFKVAVVLAVRHTNDLQLIALASVSVVAAETGIFLHQLRVSGNRELASLGRTVLRAVVSIALTCTVLSLVPGAWSVVDSPRPLALLYGALLGALTFAVFLACQTILWLAAGRPSGAERRVADIASQAVRRRYLPT